VTVAGVRPANGSAEGLGAVLARLGDELSVLADRPYVIGDPPATEPRLERYLRLQVIGLAPQPYRGEAQMARISAEVLVEAYEPDHAGEADTAANLLLHLLADGRWDVIAGQSDAAWWTALGRSPRPALLVAVPVTLPIERRTAPPVRHPLQVRELGARPVGGRVLAADGTPLAGARVRLRPDGVAVTTGYDGRWALRVPNTLVHLDVSARGRETTYDLPANSASPGPGAGERIDVDIVLSDVGVPPAAPD
jgi:hypothetical protein